MCEFVSWIEFEGKVLFLKDSDIKVWLKSKGLPLCPDTSERQGHAAIRAYYQIWQDDGVDKECTDFSSPSNFPKEIARAIKAGKMTYGDRGIPKGLFLDAVYDKWQADWDDFDAKQKAEWVAVWDAVRNAKWQAERDGVNAKWQAERDAVNAKGWKLFATKKNRAEAWR